MQRNTLEVGSNLLISYTVLIFYTSIFWVLEILLWYDELLTNSLNYHYYNNLPSRSVFAMEVWGKHWFAAILT